MTISSQGSTELTAPDLTSHIQRNKDKNLARRRRDAEEGKQKNIFCFLRVFMKLLTQLQHLHRLFLKTFSASASPRDTFPFSML